RGVVDCRLASRPWSRGLPNAEPKCAPGLIRRRFGAILTGPAARSAASGTVSQVVGEMSPSAVCATGTGIGAARALILWPELVTLGKRCSRWPSWLWPLIIDGTIIPAALGIVALAPYRDQLRNRGSSGWFWGEPPQCGRQRAARLTCHSSAGVVDAGRWRNVAAWRCRTVFLMPYRGGLFGEVEFARGASPNPVAVDRRITVSWLTSVLGEGVAPSTSLVTWKGRCWCRLGFQTLRTTW